MGTLINRECTALFRGNWIYGIIISHRMKEGECDIKTEKYGLITVFSCKIRILNKEDD